MSNGNTVDILDKDAFPSKVTSLRSAASDVRTKAAALAQIIDAAFEMVQRLLSVSNDFARDLVEVTETTLGRATGGDGGGDSD